MSVRRYLRPTKLISDSVLQAKPAIRNINETANTDDWTIYPNPAQDQIHVTLASAPAGNMELLVFDITGKKVFKGTITGMISTFYLNNISKGLYIVKLKGDGKERVKKIQID